MTLAIIFNGKAQTYSSLIDDSTIMEFMKWKIEKDTSIKARGVTANFTLSKHILKWHEYEINIDTAKAMNKDAYMCFRNTRTDWLDSIFSAKDYLFFTKQNSSRLKSDWKFDFFDNSITNSKYNHYLMLPLFSINKKYVIIKDLFYCGQGCGEFFITLYKKSSNGWEYLSELIGGTF